MQVIKDIEAKFTEVEQVVEEVVAHIGDLEAIKARVIAMGEKLKSAIGNATPASDGTDVHTV